VEDTEDGDDEEDAQPPRKVARSKQYFYFFICDILLTSSFVAENFQAGVRFVEAGPSDE
jgi:hypothetical protein